MNNFYQPQFLQNDPYSQGVYYPYQYPVNQQIDQNQLNQQQLEDQYYDYPQYYPEQSSENSYQNCLLNEFTAPQIIYLEIKNILLEIKIENYPHIDFYYDNFNLYIRGPQYSSDLVLKKLIQDHILPFSFKIVSQGYSTETYKKIMKDKQFKYLSNKYQSFLITYDYFLNRAEQLHEKAKYQKALQWHYETVEQNPNYLLLVTKKEGFQEVFDCIKQAIANLDQGILNANDEILTNNNYDQVKLQEQAKFSQSFMKKNSHSQKNKNQFSQQSNQQQKQQLFKQQVKSQSNYAEDSINKSFEHTLILSYKDSSIINDKSQGDNSFDSDLLDQSFKENISLNSNLGNVIPQNFSKSNANNNYNINKQLQNQQGVYNSNKFINKNSKNVYNNVNNNNNYIRNNNNNNYNNNNIKGNEFEKNPQNQSMMDYQKELIYQADNNKIQQQQQKFYNQQQQIFQQQQPKQTFKFQNKTFESISSCSEEENQNKYQQKQQFDRRKSQNKTNFQKKMIFESDPYIIDEVDIVIAQYLNIIQFIEQQYNVKSQYDNTKFLSFSSTKSEQIPNLAIQQFLTEYQKYQYEQIIENQESQIDLTLKLIEQKNPEKEPYLFPFYEYKEISQTLADKYKIPSLLIEYEKRIQENKQFCFLICYTTQFQKYFKHYKNKISQIVNFNINNSNNGNKFQQEQQQTYQQYGQQQQKEFNNKGKHNKFSKVINQSNLTFYIEKITMIDIEIIESHHRMIDFFPKKNIDIEILKGYINNKLMIVPQNFETIMQNINNMQQPNCKSVYLIQLKNVNPSQGQSIMNEFNNLNLSLPEQKIVVKIEQKSDFDSIIKKKYIFKNFVLKNWRKEEGLIDYRNDILCDFEFDIVEQQIKSSLLINDASIIENKFARKLQAQSFQLEFEKFIFKNIQKLQDEQFIKEYEDSSLSQQSGDENGNNFIQPVDLKEEENKEKQNINNLLVTNFSQENNQNFKKNKENNQNQNNLSHNDKQRNKLFQQQNQQKSSYLEDDHQQQKQDNKKEQLKKIQKNPADFQKAYIIYKFKSELLEQNLAEVNKTCLKDDVRMTFQNKEFQLQQSKGELILFINNLIKKYIIDEISAKEPKQELMEEEDEIEKFSKSEECESIKKTIQSKLKPQFLNLENEFSIKKYMKNDLVCEAISILQQSYKKACEDVCYQYFLINYNNSDSLLFDDLIEVLSFLKNKKTSNKTIVVTICEIPNNQFFAAKLEKWQNSKLCQDYYVNKKYEIIFNNII